MRVIGLTGGVGSGKSFAAQLLNKICQGELLITDELGHKVMEKYTTAYQQIVETFGTTILDEEENIIRDRLSKLVFASQEKLDALNSIIHPAVKAYLRDYIDKRREKEGIIILESAILYETDCDKFCDEVWFVCVSEEIRIERLMASRGYTREKCLAIMQKQQTEQVLRERADVVVENNGSVVELEAYLQSICASKGFISN